MVATNYKTFRLQNGQGIWVIMVCTTFTYSSSPFLCSSGTLLITPSSKFTYIASRVNCKPIRAQYLITWRYSEHYITRSKIFSSPVTQQRTSWTLDSASSIQTQASAPWSTCSAPLHTTRFQSSLVPLYRIHSTREFHLPMQTLYLQLIFDSGCVECFWVFKNSYLFLLLLAYEDFKKRVKKALTKSALNTYFHDQNTSNYPTSGQKSAVSTFYLVRLKKCFFITLNCFGGNLQNHFFIGSRRVTWVACRLKANAPSTSHVNWWRWTRMATIRKEWTRGELSIFLKLLISVCCLFFLSKTVSFSCVF